jgi:site-specific recombinase XerC
VAEGAQRGEDDRLRLRYHDLRHHGASHLVMSYVDIYAVSRVLGHASPKQSARSNA